MENRTPLPSLSKVSKTEWTLVHAQSPLDVATSDEGAPASPLGIPVKSQAPPLELDVASCDEGVRRLTPEVTVTSIKSKYTTSNKMPSTSWFKVLLFLINVLPSLIFAQVNVSEYVTYVAGTDTVNAALSNTPPNVFPGARFDHAGFYERSQKCYYTFGGFNGGNREMIVILTFIIHTSLFLDTILA